MSESSLTVTELDGTYSAGEPAIRIGISIRNAAPSAIWCVGLQARLSLGAGSSYADIDSPSFFVATGANSGRQSLAPTESHIYYGHARLPRHAVKLASEYPGDAEMRFELIVAKVLIQEEQTWTPMELVARDVKWPIPRSTWTGWLGRWRGGRDVLTVTVTGSVARRLGAFREAEKYADDNDVVLALLADSQAHRTPRAEHDVSVVGTSQSEHSLRDALRALCAHVAATRYPLAIMTPYLDGSLRTEIAEASRSGAPVRLIVRDPQLDKSASRRAAIDTLKGLQGAGVQIRASEMLHARLLVSTDQLIVGSADLKSDSLNTNREFGVHVRDPHAVLKAEAFFEATWEEALPWKLEGAQA